MNGRCKKKALSKTIRGCRNLDLLKSYLAKLMWRDRYGDNAHHMSINILCNYVIICYVKIL